MTGYQPSGRRAADIAADVEAAVAAGRAPAGTVLPPVRSLAADLGVAAGTVAAAYRLLAERGVVEGNRRAGTRIRPRPYAAPQRVPVVPPGTRDLASGNPDPALLPDLTVHLRAVVPASRLYGGPSVLPALAARAARWFAGDGITLPEIAVTSGALDAIDRVFQAHLRPGMRVAVEDPGYAGLLDLVAALGLETLPVTVDGFGMTGPSLRSALENGAQAVVLTPRAQNPTGAALSPARAAELAEVLDRAPEVLVVEDDHAGPVAGAAMVTVVGAPGGRVGRRAVVIRSCSKSFGPDLRVALVAGDPLTVAAAAARYAAGPGWVSHLLQQVAVAVLSDPEASTGLDRAAAAYSDRRRALVAALSDRGVPALGTSGLNVWVPVADEGTVVAGMAARGWAVAPGSRFRLASPPAVRVTVATLAPGEAGAVADDLVASCGEPGRTRAG